MALIRSTFFLSLALTIQALAQPLPELGRPTLKREAVVAGDIVRIGDLIDNAGASAQVAIFRAPDLGESGNVPAQRILDAVRAHAIIGLDTAGIIAVTVTRPSRMVSGKDIEAEIAKALAAHYGVGEPHDLLVTFDREVRMLQVEPSTQTSARVLRLGYDARTLRFDATLEYPGSRPQRFTGTATATLPAAALTRSVSRGEVVRMSDVMVERRPRADVNGDVLNSVEAVVGRAARQNLRAGQALRGNDLTKPELVSREAAVTLVYQVPGISLTVRGKALEGGAEGDVISVLNLQSKRNVQGTIAANGHIVVGPAGSRVIAQLKSETSKAAVAVAAQ